MFVLSMLDCYVHMFYNDLRSLHGFVWIWVWTNWGVVVEWDEWGMSGHFQQTGLRAYWAPNQATTAVYALITPPALEPIFLNGRIHVFIKKKIFPRLIRKNQAKPRELSC